MTDNRELITRTEPWLTEAAITLIVDYLIKFQYPFIAEFGSGASTVWFNNLDGYLISVEHDKNWYDEVSKNIIRNHRQRNKYFLKELPYHNALDICDDGAFDLILVDGRNRNACIRSAIPKLKKGGWLVLDNSERHHYEPGKSLMSEWNQIHCQQRIPDKYGFYQEGWTTSIYIKP